MGLRDQLRAVYEKNGRLTGEILVKAATPKRHPLHGQFEWDDTIAGPKWRLAQADDLIRSVRIVRIVDDGPTDCGRYFVSVPRDTGRGYEPVEDVAQDPIAREIVLREMARDWKALRDRYDCFEEFIALVEKDLAA